MEGVILTYYAKDDLGKIINLDSFVIFDFCRKNIINPENLKLPIAGMKCDFEIDSTFKIYKVILDTTT